jgi:outer membrane protein assembly factor BamB
VEFCDRQPRGGFSGSGKWVVYATSTDANVYALDAHTGVELWNYTTGDVVPGSPTVVNGVLYFTSYDDNVYAFSLSGRANQDGVSAPDISTLRPDLSLKVSN